MCKAVQTPGGELDEDGTRQESEAIVKILINHNEGNPTSNVGTAFFIVRFGTVGGVLA